MNKVTDINVFRSNNKPMMYFRVRFSTKEHGVQVLPLWAESYDAMVKKLPKGATVLNSRVN